MFTYFSRHRGFLLAGGLSYQMIFAVFAAIWVGFAIAGLVLRSNAQLSAAVFDSISRSLPGLLDWNGNDGIIDPETLLEVQILNWTGAVAAVGLFITALGWLSSARDAVRALFDLPGERRNFLLLKLRDIILAIAFGFALLVSSALTLFSTQALDSILGWLGVASESPISGIAARATGLLLMLVLDTTVLAMLYRVLSGLKIPLRRLIIGSVFGAVGLGILKVLGSVLIGGAGRNPLLASFTVIIGLLIWFSLICYVILFGATWIAVGMDDAKLDADPRIAAERRAAQEARAREEALEKAAIAAQAQSWFARWVPSWPRRRGGPD